MDVEEQSECWTVNRKENILEECATLLSELVNLICITDNRICVSNLNTVARASQGLIAAAHASACLRWPCMFLHVGDDLKLIRDAVVLLHNEHAIIKRDAVASFAELNSSLSELKFHFNSVYDRTERASGAANVSLSRIESSRRNDELITLLNRSLEEHAQKIETLTVKLHEAQGQLDARKIVVESFQRALGEKSMELHAAKMRITQLEKTVTEHGETLDTYRLANAQQLAEYTALEIRHRAAQQELQRCTEAYCAEVVALKEELSHMQQDHLLVTGPTLSNSQAASTAIVDDSFWKRSYDSLMHAHTHLTERCTAAELRAAQLEAMRVKTVSVADSGTVMDFFIMRSDAGVVTDPERKTSLTDASTSPDSNDSYAATENDGSTQDHSVVSLTARLAAAKKEMAEVKENLRLSHEREMKQHSKIADLLKQRADSKSALDALKKATEENKQLRMIAERAHQRVESLEGQVKSVLSRVSSMLPDTVTHFN